MPKEITGYIFVSPNNENDFIFKRDVQYILSLDEGHDVPYWAWVKMPKNMSEMPGRVWVPEEPSTILTDGLLMAVAEGLGDESLMALVEGNSKATWSNLRIEGGLDDARKLLGAALSGYSVNVLAFPGSSLHNLVSDAMLPGVNVTLFAALQRHAGA